MQWKNGRAAVEREVYGTTVPVVVMVAEQWSKESNRHERTGWHVCIDSVYWYHIDCQAAQSAIDEAVTLWGDFYLRPKDDARPVAEWEPRLIDGLGGDNE